MTDRTVWRSILEFRVREGAQAEFESAFSDAGMLTRPRGVDGFISAELIHALEDPAEYVAIAEWSSPAAYAAWQAQAQSGAPRDALRRLGAAIVERRYGRLFEVIGRSASAERDR